ncbi:MAG: GGDEF domain-containing protein [Alteromonadaceae bacterium]|nr:GGDEF domain-containing protein [Alteromonadaceae bacterium]
MQTLNILDNKFSELNAFKIFDNSSSENLNSGVQLLKQLQVTLELENILNIFAMEASKYVDFSGLYFRGEKLSAAIEGSRKAKINRQFKLKINNESIGILSYSINSPINATNFKVLQQLHQYLVYPLKNAVLYQEAMALAMQDGLTKLGNRRYFDEQLQRAMHHANRHKKQVGLLVCDLDKFKAINDTFGHPIGDSVLIHFAKALQSSIRNSDSVFRFGGDEFAIIVEDAGEQSLHVIENRINHAITTDPLLAKYKVSCSLGYTFMTETDNEKSLFERADQTLYQQKYQQNISMPCSLSIV